MAASWLWLVGLEFVCFSAIKADTSGVLIFSGYKFPHLSGLAETAGGAVLCPILAASFI